LDIWHGLQQSAVDSAVESEPSCLRTGQGGQIGQITNLS